MVNTSHPGNIGAAARAMKNMCLNQLYLVAPNDFPSAEASLRASHAEDIVNQAVVTSTLAEAIADCGLVIGTSARERTMNWVIENPRQTAETVWQHAADHPVAIVFGRERTGLTNAELELCHRLVHIPTNPEYSSLNVAAAIQVVCYEIYGHSLGAEQNVQKKTQAEDRIATATELQTYQEHLFQTMSEIEFFGTNHPEKVMRRLKIFFNRAQPTQRELNILHGILTSMQRKLR